MYVRRGVVDSYDSASHSAQIRLEGSTGVLHQVPVLRVIPATELVPGCRVVVAVWEDIGAVVLGSYAN